MSLISPRVVAEKHLAAAVVMIPRRQDNDEGKPPSPAVVIRREKKKRMRIYLKKPRAQYYCCGKCGNLKFKGHVLVCPSTSNGGEQDDGVSEFSEMDDFDESHLGEGEEVEKDYESELEGEHLVIANDRADINQGSVKRQRNNKV
jgi:hypothetical protein